jgi:hypothetical protein
MNKVLLFSAIAAMVTFYSCKKDDKTVTVTNTVHDTITNTVTVFASGMINGDSLSTGINVAYGTRVSDSIFPAASTDAAAPVLDTNYKRFYSVVRSRYLTVYPPNVAGYVAGYYVQIVGAKSYFKIDYPAAEAERKAAREAKSARLSKTNNGRGNGEGYIDSTIVLKIPASVYGDTFYIKYAAYDLSNRVSKPVTAMVVILPEGSAGLTDSLSGNWNYLSYRINNNGIFDGDWTVDTSDAYFQYYTCDGTTLTVAYQESDYYLPTTAYSNPWQYQLGKYSMIYYKGQIRRDLDLSNSTCANPVYSIYYSYINEYHGGYSYDALTRKITFITDGDGNGYSSSDLSYDSYYLSELTGSTMILSGDNKEVRDENYTRLYKFVKQ